MTSSQLVAIDSDQSIDIYDAHVCSSSSPCLEYPEGSTRQCESASDCRPGTVTQTPTSSPASANFSGSASSVGTAKQTVGASKTTTKPKRLTRAQKLKRALKACRKRHGHAKRERCERQARNKYAQHTHKAAKKKGKQKR